MNDIKNILCKKVPEELVNFILYKNKGLTHPIALIIKKIVNDCEDYIYLDSGGSEIFVNFQTYCSYYPTRGNPYKTISLRYYIEGLDKW